MSDVVVTMSRVSWTANSIVNTRYPEYLHSGRTLVEVRAGNTWHRNGTKIRWQGCTVGFRRTSSSH